MSILMNIKGFFKSLKEVLKFTLTVICVCVCVLLIGVVDVSADISMLMWDGMSVDRARNCSLV